MSLFFELAKKRKIAALSVFTIMLVLAVILLWGYYFIKPLSVTSGSIVLTAPRFLSLAADANVQINRDAWGVPYISSQDHHLLYFGLGYSHAQDRLWQMEVLRLSAKGKLSMLFGENMRHFDYLLLTLGFYRIAEQTIAQLATKQNLILASYAAGVNAYIKENVHHLSPELMLLQHTPLPWRSEDSLAIIKYNLWQQQNKLRHSVLKEALSKQNLTAENAANLGRQSLVEHIIYLLQDSSSVLSNAKANLSPIARSLIAEVFESNHLLVPKDVMADGQSVMVIRPFGKINSIPAPWYPAAIQGQDINVQGLTMPGVPVFMIGRNEYIAWAFASSNLENIYSFDLLDYNKWRQSGHAAQKRNEEIYYYHRDKLVQDKIAVETTDVGPLVTQAFNAFSDTLKLESEQVLRWSGFQPASEFVGYSQAIYSRSWQQFRKAMREIKTPVGIAYYSDRDQNIGAVFLNGSNGPYMFNPERGILRESDLLRTERNIGLDQESTRLWQKRLDSKQKITIEELMLMQADSQSSGDERFCRLILPFLTDNKLNSQNDALAQFIRQNISAYNNAIRSLASWQGFYAKDEVAPALVQSIKIALLRNTLYNKLGETLTDELLQARQMPDKLAHLLAKVGSRNDESPWFDNPLSKDHTETFSEIIRLSFFDAIFYLQKNIGKSVKDWTWGEVNRLQLLHSFGNSWLGATLFQRGPYPVSGMQSSTQKNISLPYQSRNIALAHTAQVIINGWDKPILYAFFGGISGNPASPNYFDIGQRWLKKKSVSMAPWSDFMAKREYRRLHLTFSKQAE